MTSGGASTAGASSFRGPRITELTEPGVSTLPLTQIQMISQAPPSITNRTSRSLPKPPQTATGTGLKLELKLELAGGHLVRTLALLPPGSQHLLRFYSGSHRPSPPASPIAAACAAANGLPSDCTAGLQLVTSSRVVFTREGHDGLLRLAVLPKDPAVAPPRIGSRRLRLPIPATLVEEMMNSEVGTGSADFTCI